MRDILFVISFHYFRKATASTLAVDERQSLETLKREDKTAARALAQLSEKEQAALEKKASRTEELGTLTEKRQEVCPVPAHPEHVMVMENSVGRKNRNYAKRVERREAGVGQSAVRKDPNHVRCSFLTCET